MRQRPHRTHAGRADGVRIAVMHGMAERFGYGIYIRAMQQCKSIIGVTGPTAQHFAVYHTQQRLEALYVTGQRREGDLRQTDGCGVRPECGMQVIERKGGWPFRGPAGVYVNVTGAQRR